MLAKSTANVFFAISTSLDWAEVQKELLAVLGSASVITLVWLGLAWALKRCAKLNWARIWPRQRFFTVSWTLWQVVLLILFSVAANQLLVSLVVLPPNWAMFRFFLVKLIDVAIYLLIPLYVFKIPGYQLGLSGWRWREDIVLGFALWIPAAAITWSVWLVTFLLTPTGNQADHAMIQEIQKVPSLSNWIALILAAILLAPIVEEVLFRGVILRSLAAEPLWADLIMLIALVTAMVKGYGATTWGPVLFLVSVGPGYLAFEWVSKKLLPRPGLARAVYASSLVFAAAHAEAWPTPIPLFFLALFLGLAAARTQSLLAPCLIHAAFNASTVLALAWQLR